MSEALFAERDGAFVPSGHARGPWDPDAMHGGAPAALLAHAIERLDTPGPMLLARLSMEFLGAVPLAPVTVEASVVRPGRRMQLVEAVIRAGGTPMVRATGTLLRREPVAAPAPIAPLPVLPGPDSGREIAISLDGSTGGESFALSGMEIRTIAGRFGAPGPATAWFRLRRPVVEGEPISPVQRAFAAGDFGNGLGAEVRFDTHVFVNTDLTVHLSREPVGEWVAIDARTEHGPEGTALAYSILHDAGGPVGIAAQSLYVAER